MIEVRPFVADDLPTLWALAHLPDAGTTEDPSVPVPLPPRRVAPSGPPDLVDPDGRVTAVGGLLLVATSDGHVVGAGGLRPVTGRPRLGRVIRLRVHPALRRQGVGSSLMDSLEAAARRRGLTDLLLDVGDHQPEALAFYRALGWSETWREASPEWQWQTVWFHRSLERDHLTVEVRPCAGEADVEAAERALPTRGNGSTARAGSSSAPAARRTCSPGTVTRWSATCCCWSGRAARGHPGPGRGSGGQGAGRGRAGAAARRRHRADGRRSRRGPAARRASVGLAVEPDNDAATDALPALGWSRRPGLAPVDEWSWTDERGVLHEERDRCGYWMLTAVPQG